MRGLSTRGMICRLPCPVALSYVYDPARLVCSLGVIMLIQRMMSSLGLDSTYRAVQLDKEYRFKSL